MRRGWLSCSSIGVWKFLQFCIEIQSYFHPNLKNFQGLVVGSIWKRAQDSVPGATKLPFSENRQCRTHVVRSIFRSITSKSNSRQSLLRNCFKKIQWQHRNQPLLLSGKTPINFPNVPTKLWSPYSTRPQTSKTNFLIINWIFFNLIRKFTERRGWNGENVLSTIFSRLSHRIFLIKLDFQFPQICVVYGFFVERVLQTR